MESHCECGKIQYIQEKQGFIRCNRRVNGKRDIIFFLDETGLSIRNKLKLGMNVNFYVLSGTKTNIKGGIITHWAVIRNIADKNQDSGPVIKQSPRDCISTHSSDSEENTAACSLNNSSFSDNQALCINNVLSFLLGEVYKGLYKKDLPSITNGMRNCWQV